MFRKLGNYFIAGVVLALPIGVTIFVFAFLIRHIGTPVSDMLFAPVFKYFDATLPESALGGALLDALATVVVMILVTILGMVSNWFFAGWIIGAFEKAINKIPGVGIVYRTVKQIVDTFSKQNRAIFQSVALVEFPRKGMYAVGFITSKAQGEVQERTGDVVVNVFVPTTPNPTSGFLIMVPENEIEYLDMSVGDAMKLIISGGAVVPKHLPKQTAQAPK